MKSPALKTGLFVVLYHVSQMSTHILMSRAQETQAAWRLALSHTADWLLRRYRQKPA